MTISAPAVKQRINSIDVLRGIVMIIMALDHIRDYLHIHGADEDPTNITTTTPALFFTRFITHYCAPIFVFLSGTSIYLQALRKSKKELSVFLLKRGLWLMLAEIVIVNLLMTFNPLYNFLILQVIWVIGLSMVLMAAIVFLPFRVIFWLAIVMVFTHNWFDRFSYPNPFQVPFWYGLLHQQSFFQYNKTHFVGVMYPLIPWVGVMMLGYCLGAWYQPNANPLKRQKKLLYLGIAVIVFFIVLRYGNVYGDPSKWSFQSKGTIFTIISFINVAKYPPSLLYLCITLGPALIMLSLLERTRAGWTNIVSVYGRVPFYYYLWHFFLAHLITVIFFFASGKGTKDIIDVNVPFLFRPQHWGFPLWVIYLVWMGLIIVLYPICKRYDSYKMNNKKWWLSYL